MNPETTGGSSPVRTDSPRDVSGVVDWLVAGALVLVGLAMVVAGAIVSQFTDRALVADLVAEGTIQSDALSSADLVEVSLAVAEWAWIGLAATGLLLAVAGVVFVATRRRTRREAEAADATASTFTANAVYGAVATVVLSFVPASPVLGGAVASYLQGDREHSGAKIGAVSGVIAGIPVVSLVGFVLVGVLQGMLAIGESALATLVGGVAVFALAVLLLFNAGLGAVGGIVGQRFLDRSGR